MNQYNKGKALDDGLGLRLSENKNGSDGENNSLELINLNT